MTKGPRPRVEVRKANSAQVGAWQKSLRHRGETYIVGNIIVLKFTEPPRCSSCEVNETERGSEWCKECTWDDLEVESPGLDLD